MSDGQDKAVLAVVRAADLPAVVEGPLNPSDPNSPAAAEFSRGYPKITDPTHPLWSEQQAGWPKMAADIALLEVQRIADEARDPGFVNSRSHPAFKPGYIRNDHAEPAGEDRTKWLPRPEDKERR